mmetsp:Transcript_23402/g.67431  ORF Transcript_23402/g.67431 Transcript_23402/m.67431 type:complete len:205 (+) Transcript_23402:1482-2096(+)
MGQGHIALPSEREETNGRNPGRSFSLLVRCRGHAAISKGKLRLVPVADGLRSRTDVLNVDPPLRSAPLVHFRGTVAPVLPGLLLQGAEALLDPLDDLLGRLLDELHLLPNELIGVRHPPVRGELVADVVLGFGLAFVVLVSVSSVVLFRPVPLGVAAILVIVIAPTTSTLGTLPATTRIVGLIVPLGIHDLAVLGLALGVVDEP